MSDTKKEVCRTLTNVVRNSTLEDRIDPKSFYVMLNTNFSVLFQQGTVDLVPVWNALAGEEAPAPLYGLFLAFQDAAQAGGFEVRLPPAVHGLTAEQRPTYLNLSHPSDAAAPPSVVEVTDEEFYQTDPHAKAIPLSLETGDVKPFLPDDLKRDVVQLVVHSLKDAPVGERLDTAQLAYLVDSNFEDLCDGQNFDFGPILGGLRQLDGVQDSDVYAGVVTLEIALAERGIVLSPIQMDVDQELAGRLLQEAEAKAKARAEQAALEARARTQSKEKPPAPPPVTSAPLEVPTGGDKREQRLRRWGLRMLSERRVKALRYAVLTLGLLVVVGVGWFLRPNKVIDVAQFSGLVPMKAAELRDGVFYGTVDEAKWWPLPVDARAQRIKGLETKMRAEGLIANAQIRDTQERLVIVATGGKLKGAAFFRLGDKDGTIPRDLLDTEEAPPEARAAAEKAQEAGGK